jgi:hypothetical protein
VNQTAETHVQNNKLMILKIETKKKKVQIKKMKIQNIKI